MCENMGLNLWDGVLSARHYNVVEITKQNVENVEIE